MGLGIMYELRAGCSRLHACWKGTASVRENAHTHKLRRIYMPVRKAHAVWEGDLMKGKGTMSFGSFEGPYSFSSRFENGKGANPEELIGAAFAGCFSMALSHELAQKGHAPVRIATNAEVHLEKSREGFAIEAVHLSVKGKVPGVSEKEFKETTAGASRNCPVARALAGTKISVEAALEA
jgi:osmotically inducible protein OsmC